MTIKTIKIIHLIVSFFFMLLATSQIGARKEPQEASAPPPSEESSEYHELLALLIPYFAGLVILIPIALVLFKKGFINSHGLILTFWLWAWISRETALVILSKGLLNLLGLAYCIHLGGRDYKNKNTWFSSTELLFETGEWLSVFILSCIELILRLYVRDRHYHKISYWYPITIIFIAIVENYWTNGRKMRANLSKSQLVKNVEDAFDDLIGACTKEQPQSGIIIPEFDHKVKAFKEMFFDVVAQRQEALREKVDKTMGA